MKKLVAVLVGILLLCSSVPVVAQTYLDVPPGVGTLNSAVVTNQGNVIYRLEAGGWYTLDGVIENNGFHLQIIGTTPGPGEMPAAIQTATKPDATVLEHMFDVVGDLTVKNVFIVNADPNNTIGSGVFDVKTAGTARVVFDSIVVDPVGNNRLLRFEPCPFPKVFITNSLFMRHGNLNGSNDWCLFDLAGAPENGYDTLYLENNTFISTGTHIFINRSVTDSNNFMWVNHNTFAFHKFVLLNTWHTNDYFITNNLFFDFCTQPYNYAWSAYGPDGMGNIRSALVGQDTIASDIVGGAVNSQRKFFLAYNNEYLDPRVDAYLDTWQFANTKDFDGVTPLEPAYLMKLMYPPDSAAVSREARMFADNVGFPYYKFINYTKTDPQFSNPKFYEIQDSIVNWALPAMMLNSWGFSPDKVDPLPANAGNWWWCDDPTNNLGNPEVWPRISGADYTNTTMLTASIEGLPLGDLNWFPTQKALWQSKQGEIMDWIVDENETPFQITAIEPEENNLPLTFALGQNYPNPFNPTTEVIYSIPQSGMVTLKVFNVLGQEVATLVNSVQSAGSHRVSFDGAGLSSGIYMYQIHAGTNIATRKMVLMK